jgi:hypothetical protein
MRKVEVFNYHTWEWIFHHASDLDSLSACSPAKSVTVIEGVIIQPFDQMRRVWTVDV